MLITFRIDYIKKSGVLKETINSESVTSSSRFDSFKHGSSGCNSVVFVEDAERFCSEAFNEFIRSLAR